MTNRTTRNPRPPLVLAVAGAMVAALTLGAAARPRVHKVSSENPSGVATTLSTRGPLDLQHPFFRSTGTNGRACSSCHDPADGWTTTPARLQARFEASGGLDPVFRAHDGANSPLADTSTVAARRTAYSMLLQRGVFRIGLPIPEDAEFTLEHADDPYGYAGAAELSLFRRCLPATNLRFNSTIMWDGRETHPGATLAQNLASQAQGAHKGHSQGTVPLTDEEVAQIVDFEAGLFTAQTQSAVVGKLGKKAGPKSLTKTRFVEGMNSPFAGGKKSRFKPEVFNLFKSWRKLPKSAKGLKGNRRLIARGEQIFNGREFIVSDVPGFNDVIGSNNVVATCSTCHNVPNVGTLSLNLPMDIGVKRLFRRTP
ncbi:MAG: hypothetical protein ACK47B_28645, partial [Armatimonadota bacterium]